MSKLLDIAISMFETDTTKKIILEQYISLFEQQVILGNLIENAPPQAVEGILDEQTEKSCIEAALLVSEAKQQGLDDVHALVAAIKRKLKK